MGERHPQMGERHPHMGGRDLQIGETHPPANSLEKEALQKEKRRENVETRHKVHSKVAKDPD